MKEYGGYIEFENYHGSMLHDGTITRSSMPSLDEYVDEIRPIW